MKRNEAIKRTQQQVGIGPEIITILPIVFDVIQSFVAACKKPADAITACCSPTLYQRQRLVAETMRRMRQQGKKPNREQVVEAVMAACETARKADVADVGGFVVNCYLGV